MQTPSASNLDVLFLAAAAIVIVFGTLLAFASRYKKCPSDRILVVYGKVSSGKSAHCLHGGAAFIWPIIQDYQFLDLTPMPIEINLQGALSKQNIRVNTPSTFTVGVRPNRG
jgi:flotillin